jgi:hypothetical protein
LRGGTIKRKLGKDTQVVKKKVENSSESVSADWKKRKRKQYGVREIGGTGKKM